MDILIGIGIVATVLIVGVALVPVFRYLRQQHNQSSSPLGSKSRTSNDAQTIDMRTQTIDGVTVAESPEQRAAAQKAAAQKAAAQKAAAQKEQAAAAAQRQAHRNRRQRPEEASSATPLFRRLGQIGLVVLFGGVIITALWFWANARTAQEQAAFLVLVAPFEDGGDGSTGQAVANELVTVLQNDLGDIQILAQSLETAPTNSDAALRLARENDADILIWGTVEPGGLLDDQTLQPRLTYTPNGSYAPNAWFGYPGRFSLAQDYALSTAPINGRAVLPPLIGALATYSAGESEMASIEFERLIQDYQLSSSLLYALRGNVLWAQGAYVNAATAYRQALLLPNERPALFNNNLGAILLDAGDPTASETLQLAAQQLDGAELAALRYNMGLLALNEGRYEDALVELEQAHNLLTHLGQPTAPLLLTLAETYTTLGRYGDASTTLNKTEQTLANTVDQVPFELQTMLQEQIQADLLEQHSLLALTEMVQARGPLQWELEIAPPIELGDLRPITNDLREAIDHNNQRTQAWLSRSVSVAAAETFDEAELPIELGLIAKRQSFLSQRDGTRYYYHLAITLIEEERSPQMQIRSDVERLWSSMTGGDNPGAEARRILAEELAITPQNVQLLLADARALLVQSNRFPSGESAAPLITEADAHYNQVQTLAPDRPEGYYGKAQIALTNSDGVGARQFLQQAIERNERYYPARITLAQLAEQDGDWQTAIEQHSIVAEHYPTPSSQYVLARALHQSGADLAAAESLLVDLTAAPTDEAIDADTRARALLELAELYAKQGETDKATAVLDEASEIRLYADEIQVARGTLLAAQEDAEAARDAYIQAIENSTTPQQEMEARLQLAALYAGPLEEPELALAEYETVATSDTIDDPQTLITVGDRLLFEYERVESAIQAYNRAASLPPNDTVINPRIEVRLATAYEQRGNLTEAQQRADNVLRLTDDPNLRAAALVVQGDVQRLQGNLDGAIDLYNQALTLQPENVDAVLGIGLVGVARNNWSLALTQFERAVRLPDGQTDALAHFWYAEALLRENSLQPAIDQYNLALALRPIFPEAHLGKAQAEHARGDRNRAHSLVDRALEQRPDYAEAHLFRGKLLQEEERIDEALEAYSASIAASSELSEPYYRRGLIYINRENYDQAISDLRNTIRLAPNNGEAYYWLSQAYFALNRVPEGIAVLEDALRLANQDNEIVIRTRAELERVRQEQEQGQLQ